MPLPKKLAYREDFETVMRYLVITESKHAPKFNLLETPKELQELM